MSNLCSSRVLSRLIPKYHLRFSKVSHSVELRAQGYRAVVLPDAFVVHTPYAPPHDITAFRGDPHYRICLTRFKQEFMEDLKRKYNVTLDELCKSDDIEFEQKPRDWIEILLDKWKIKW